MTTDRTQLFLTKAREFLSADSLLTDSEDCSRYGTDWTKTPGKPFAVALPRSTAEVALILRLCHELKVPVVPSGGRTGLAGGAVAGEGQLALSLERMNQKNVVDTTGMTLRVQAGATTASVHEHCAPHGLTWPIDLAAKGTSQIGGNLSTNAGGLRVIRYGMARKWVVGLQAVTIRGEVLELNQDLEKNNTGYDLVQILCGSEGTLAVITEATLKLARLPRRTAVLFFPFPDAASVQSLFEKARRGPFEIQAFEFFSERCLKAVTAKLGYRSRLQGEAKFYALMEIEIAEDASAFSKVEDWLGAMLEQGVVSDGMLANSSADQKEVWRLREGITESLQMTAPLKKYDIAVPVSRLLPFLSEVESLLNRSGYQIDLYLFGHLGDGSPHLNLLKPESASLERFLADTVAFEKDLFPILKKHSGSVSAEHGVGLLKKHWVLYSRTPEELRLFKAIKAAFDPDNLLNPGKVI